MPTANPKIMQLIILEQRVAVGKTVLKLDFTISEIPYRAMLPKPPPKKTKSKLFIALKLPQIHRLNINSTKNPQ